jgi:hypothetical protein
MVCADYSGKCQSNGEVQCSICGRDFCWDHILVLRFAREETIVQERYVCRNCTEQLFNEIEEEHTRLKRGLQVLEHDVADRKRQLEEA